jgi:hypothetical protein
VTLLAVTFLAVTFLAVAFLAVAFLAVAFFVVAFFVVTFFVVAFFAGTVRSPLAVARLVSLITSFKGRFGQGAVLRHARALRARWCGRS